MKKLLLFAALAVFGLTDGIAQDEDNGNGNDTFTRGLNKGDIYLSGGLGYSSTSTDDVKNSTFIIMPAAGIMVTDNIAVGGTVGYMSFQGEAGDVDTQDETVFQLGAYGKYIFNPENRFNYYAGLGVGYETRSYNLEGDDYKENGIGGAAFLGAGFWLSDCVAIFTQVGAVEFSSTKPDFDNAEATTRFGIGFDLKEIIFGAIVRF